MGFNTNLSKPIPNVTYVRLGDNTKQIQFVWISLKIGINQLLSKGGIKRFKVLLKALLDRNISEIKKQNVYNTIVKVKPDIIHIQWPSLISLLERILQENKFKVVLSQRGYHINVRALIDLPNFNYLQKWYPKIHGFHSVSHDLKSNGDLIYKSKNKINEVVYSGLELTEFIFNSEYTRSSKLKLLSVGRSHWKKGFASMIKVCAQLKNKNIDFHYTIVGTDIYDEELIYLIDHYQLEDFITLKPKLLQNEIFDLMKASSVLVLPSLEEGIANVAIEAMAIGLPVISTNAGGMSELIQHQKTGWMVPVLDEDKLYQEIINFNANSLDVINQVRSKAREKVELQYNQSEMIRGIIDLYAKVLTS